MVKKLDAQFFKNFIASKLKHATSMPRGFYVAQEDLYGFKKVKTYVPNADPHIVISPHKPFGRSLADQSSNRQYGTNYYNREDAIANLIIPKGAFIYLNYRIQFQEGESHVKIRASKAKLHSIVRISDQKQVVFARSKYDSAYTYDNPKFLGKESELILPDQFSDHPGVCESGIHFFLDIESALNYSQ